MSNLWRTFFGFADDDENETYEHAVVRARRLLDEENYEDACRILRFAEANRNAEAMYLLGWCYWRGQGVAEDAARAIRLWQRSAEMGFAPAQDRCNEIKDFIATL